MEKPKKLTYSESIYETRDLTEASILTALGAKYVGSKLKERDVWLAFTDKEACEETLSGYMNGAFPEIKSLINAQREVKNIILKLTARR